MPQSFRIFISSPGDVVQERVIAGRVIERLQVEFGSRIQLEAVLWEHEPIRATESFQTQIEMPSQMDAVVCIFWSRLGTRLPQGFERRPDGTPYESGTAFEFENAQRAYETYGKPALLVYRKTAEPLVSLRDPSRLRQQQEQWEALEQYLHKWFFNIDGSFKAGFTQFETADEFEQQLTRHLRNLIQNSVAEVTVVDATRTVTWHRGSPFRGLEVFEFEHAPIFFGRTRTIGEIREALVCQAAVGSAFVLILGMSGSGKSSLIRAGVLPTLTQPGVIEGVGLWRWGILRPSDAPADLLQRIAHILFDQHVLPELATAGATLQALTEACKFAPQQAILPIRMGLTRAAEELAVREQLTAPPEARLILIIDQMEELFTLSGLTPADREAFITLLAALARSGVVWILASMRSDFYHRLAELPLLVALIAGKGQYHLLPPRHAEIIQIICAPAYAAGIKFETEARTGIGLDAMIEEEALQHPEALPLLQFMLDELFKQRSANGVLTIAAYNQLGGLVGALGRRAEEAFQGLSEEEKAAVPGVIRALVTMTSADESLMLTRVASMHAFPEGTPSRAVVETFTHPDVRLFITDGDGQGARVRVAHEALFSVWERAREIILVDREFLRTRQRVEIAAGRWEEEHQSDDLLLPLGKPLGEAEDLLCQRRDELSPAVIAYIERSSVIQHEQERLTRETAQREAETAHLLARRRRMATRARMVASIVLGIWLALPRLFPSAFEPIKFFVFDTYQQLLPRQAQALPVVIVEIDEASVTALGQWPWPRTRLARLLEATHQLGARAIGLDILMPEADRLSPGVFMAERPDVSPELRHELAQLPANDTLLAETLQRTPAVVGRAGTPESTPAPVPVDDQTPMRTYGEPPLAYVQRYKGHVTNLPQLEQAAPGHGYLNAEPDQDGVVRLVPLLVAVQEALAPTLVLELLRVADRQEVYSVRADDHGVRGVQIGNTLIRTDPDGRLRLYFSKPDLRRRISALRVLQGTVPAAVVQNKIAILGVTALGLADVVSTPVATRMDGVEVQAQALENILSNTRLIRPPYAGGFEVGVSLLAGLVILLGFPRLRFLWQVVVLLAMAMLIGASSLVAFSRAQLLLDTAFPLLTMAVVYVIASSGGIVELIPSRGISV